MGRLPGRLHGFPGLRGLGLRTTGVTLGQGLQALLLLLNALLQGFHDGVGILGIDRLGGGLRLDVLHQILNLAGQLLLLLLQRGQRGRGGGVLGRLTDRIGQILLLPQGFLHAVGDAVSRRRRDRSGLFRQRRELIGNLSDQFGRGLRAIAGRFRVAVAKRFDRLHLRLDGPVEQFFNRTRLVGFHAGRTAEGLLERLGARAEFLLAPGHVFEGRGRKGRLDGGKLPVEPLLFVHQFGSLAHNLPHGVGGLVLHGTPRLLGLLADLVEPLVERGQQVLERALGNGPRRLAGKLLGLVQGLVKFSGGLPPLFQGLRHAVLAQLLGGSGLRGGGLFQRFTHRVETGGVRQPAAGHAGGHLGHHLGLGRQLRLFPSHRGKLLAVLVGQTGLGGFFRQGFDAVVKVPLLEGAGAGGVGQRGGGVGGFGRVDDRGLGFLRLARRARFARAPGGQVQALRGRFAHRPGLLRFPFAQARGGLGLSLRGFFERQRRRGVLGGFAGRILGQLGGPVRQGLLAGLEVGGLLAVFLRHRAGSRGLRQGLDLRVQGVLVVFQGINPVGQRRGGLGSSCGRGGGLFIFRNRVEGVPRGFPELGGRFAAVGHRLARVASVQVGGPVMLPGKGLVEGVQSLLRLVG